MMAQREGAYLLPTVSVIVPVYKVSAYLSRCVESILAQTYSDFELILVDDESPDNCPILCDEYTRKDERIHVLHIAHGGLSAARNAGIDYAINCSESKYITFIDSDDWVHPRYLEWLYNAMMSANTSIAVGGYEKTASSFAYSDTPSIRETTPGNLYTGNIVSFITAWGKLFHKSDFEGIRFPIGKLHEDEFTIWKIMFKYHRIALVETPVYAYFQRPDSIMGTWSPNRLVRIDAVKEQLEWLEKQGHVEMLTKVKQRMAIVYAEEIRGMTQYGMPTHTIRKYRKELRGHIRHIHKQFPLLRYVSTYETAWPIEMTIVRSVRSVLRRAKHMALHAKNK